MIMFKFLLKAMNTRQINSKLVATFNWIQRLMMIMKKVKINSKIILLKSINAKHSDETMRISRVLNKRIWNYRFSQINSMREEDQDKAHNSNSVIWNRTGPNLWAIVRPYCHKSRVKASILLKYYPNGKVKRFQSVIWPVKISY